MDLGRLEQVDLRKVWTHEAYGFTPWLATDINLKLLSDTIGIQLELEAQEKEVGPFRADLLCKNPADNSWVLVENQIERTDHSHLGQLLTYAAGLQTVTIVWIARRFTDEHRAALDWLNNVTHESIAFYGLEVELWRIGDSAPAPKFNVVCKPNVFVKNVQESRSGNPDRETFYFEYWTAFKEFVEQNSNLKTLKPNRDYWCDLAPLAPGIRLRAMAGARDKYNMVDLVVYNDPDKSVFDRLVKYKSEIEAKVPGLSWRRKDGYKESAFEIRLDGPDPTDRNDWRKQHGWMVENLIRLRTAFLPLLSSGAKLPE
jgi:hypothetical protein